MTLTLGKDPQLTSLRSDLVFILLHFVSDITNFLGLLSVLKCFFRFVIFAGEMDWDRNGEVTFREFLFGFLKWVGIDEDELNHHTEGHPA